MSFVPGLGLSICIKAFSPGRTVQSQPDVATLLPIRAVGVKGDCRSYNYCVALSSDHTQPNWNDLATYARLIPRVCHNVDRVCYIFGKAEEKLDGVYVYFDKGSHLFPPGCRGEQNQNCLLTTG
ncbi:putative GMP synthase [Daphnia magna]|uniref:Putative GMP synthase n=1 Tax=Daphnia magna TaxID=35525 RepID=A0A0P5DSF8_9CRUS|nr:putative GMP synthase [Daphnia magna]